jgi:signal transduction histidine kinase
MVLVPLLNTQYIYPLFKGLLIKNTEDEALRLGMHLADMFFDKEGIISRDRISAIMNEKAYNLINDFKLQKMKIFNPSGETIYSTSSDDIGIMNEYDYFHNIVASGRTYSKVVKKDQTTREGNILSADVVETYVPVMDEGKFIGAFELYYNITSRSRALNVVMRKSSLVPLFVVSGFLVVMTIVLAKLDRSMIVQKRTEEELKSINDQLQSEIMDRNRAEEDLVEFADKLEKSNRELESFAHVASHDLKEPLRKIKSFGDRLAAKYADTLDDRGCDYLNRMQSAANRMQNLIDGLLTFSRVTTKANPVEPVDLNTLASDVIGDLETRVEQTGGRIEVDNLPTVKADPLQMRQLMQNLIGNALKFFRENEPPVVKVQGEMIYDSEGDGSEVCQITIEDNGIGFEEEYAERIFDVFQRLHGRQQYEGTGIGLSICKRIVERHKGKIIAKSSPGKGASFIVTLPVKHIKGGTDGS